MIWFFVLVLLIFFWYFTIDIPALALNFGQNYVAIHLILHVLISILTAWVMMLEVYKYRTVKILLPKQSTVLWTIGWILGVVITWCPVCGWTLMSAFGITSVLSFLPWYGLELKFLSVFILFWAQDILIQNMFVCMRFSLWYWIKKIHISLSMWVFFVWILFVAYLLRPQTSIVLPGDTILFPTSNYTIFSYELQDWCSNASYFLETFTTTSNSSKILWLYVYDSSTIWKFLACKDPLMSIDMDMDTFDRIVSDYIAWNRNIQLNSTSYIVEYDSCIDPYYQYCLQWKYMFVKNNIVYALLANYVSWTVLDDTIASSFIDAEVAKWRLQ